MSKHPAEGSKKPAKKAEAAPAPAAQCASPTVTCDSLYEEMTRLARVLSEDKWQRQLKVAQRYLNDVRAVRQDLTDHIAEMEGDGGLLKCIRDDCPRLTMGVDRLEKQHQGLLKGLGELGVALSKYDGSKPNETEKIRSAATNLLQEMKSHQKEGNTLVLEAFATDIGTKD